MHYAIIAYGSRGDVQPYIALALGLTEKGHQVTLLANENFKLLVESYGVGFFPLTGDIEAIMYSPEVHTLLKTGNALAFFRQMQKLGRQTQPQVNEDIFQGCQLADVLIATPLTVIWVYSIAEKLQKKWVIVHLTLPAEPTREFPFAGFAFLDFPWFNLFTHSLARYMYWRVNKKGIDGHRKGLGLPSLKRSILKEIADKKTLSLYAFSPSLIAKPKDWPSHIDITGFLFAPPKDDREQDINLIEWLKKGDAPIYIGFGSIPIPNPDLLAGIMYRIIHEKNQRILFCQGWSAMPDMPKSGKVFIVEQADHEWLLPQCKLAIIHGGIGTIAAVLRAKIPMIILSVFADQPLWGKIVAGKNLGIHIPFKNLTAEKLLDAVERAQDAQMRKNASDLGDIINSENGLNKAISALENYFSSE